MSDGKIYIIDDDEAVRDSLSMLLQAENLEVETYDSAQAFLSGCTENIDPSSHCVLADVRMPGMNGLDLQRLLAKKYPSLPVIIVTGHGDLSMAVKAMKAGAADFIEKPYNAEDIVQKVMEAIESARAVAGGAPGVEGGDRSALQIAKLSPRERQVFDVLVVGNTNKEIARRLDISPRTVEVHRAHIMEKTKVRGLSQLVRMALDAGHELRDD